jgi:hypothetical protein
MFPPNHRRDRGAAMFIAVLLLVLMGALGLVALDTASEDRRIAGFQNRSNSAFAAAEAGVAHAAELAKQNNLTLPTRNLSDTTVYDRETALPSYRADPNPLPVGTNPTGIVSAGFGAAEGVAPEAGGGWKTGKYRINVEGRSPNAAGAGMDGRMSTSRIELMWGEVTNAGSDYEGQ